MDHAIGRRTIEIGFGQILEILLGAQHVGAGIIDVEEILEARELVGGADLLDACKGDRHLVPFREREHQLGLEAAFDVEMEFGLGQAGDEVVQIGHAPNSGRARGFTQAGRHSPLLQIVFHSVAVGTIRSTTLPVRT